MFREILAENVKQLRSDRKLSQEELAAKAGILVRYYQHIEAATKTPSIITVFKISKALDIHYTTLLDPALRGWLQQSNADSDHGNDE